MKKIVSLALVMLMLFVFVGCGKQGREIVRVTLSTEDAESILAAAGIRLPLPAQGLQSSISAGMTDSTTMTKTKS